MLAYKKLEQQTVIFSFYRFLNVALNAAAQMLPWPIMCRLVMVIHMLHIHQQIELPLNLCFINQWGILNPKQAVNQAAEIPPGKSSP